MKKDIQKIVYVISSISLLLFIIGKHEVAHAEFVYTAPYPIPYVVVEEPEILVPDLIAGSTSPTTAVTGTATSITADVTNQGTAGSDIGFAFAGTGFTSLFQFDNNIDHSAVTASQTVATPALAEGASTTITTSYTFTSVGTWYVRACADNNASFADTVHELDELNNCGPWTAVTIAQGGGSVPTVNLIASTNGPVAPGTSVALTIQATDFETSIVCTVNQGVGSVPMESAGGNDWDSEDPETVNPSSTTTYTATCSGPSGSDQDSETVTVTTSAGPEVCGNGIDDDEDGSIDEGCGSGVPQCSDGLDNDGDGLIDYGVDPLVNDPGCDSPLDESEQNRKKPIFIEF